MADTTHLQKRAQLAILTGVSALTAKGHLEHALINAKHGRVDHGVLIDLQRAAEALERAVKGAERCRKRLLRKADREQLTHG